MPSPAHEQEAPGDPEEVARQILLRALSAQARTRAELATLLAKKGIPGDAAAAVLDRFSDVGLIDDSAFAAAWVTSRQVRKGLSTRALRVELARKGVDREIVNEAVGGVGPADEHAVALEVARKRLGRLGDLDTATQRRRLAGLLARKGFGGSVVASVVAQVLNEDPNPDA